MSQKSIKQIAEKMTEMYNKIWATEKENDDPNKEKGKLHKGKKNPLHQRVPPKPMHPKSQLYKYCKQAAKNFKKYCFDLKENEERRPPNWKTRVE